jgi:hypothetical protein
MINGKRAAVVTIIVVLLLASGYAYYSGILLPPSSGRPESERFDSRRLIAEVDQTAIARHINVLASAEYQGRLAGHEGQYKAAEYIANEFRSYGLMPAADEGTFYQWFTYPFWRAVAPTSLTEIGGESRSWIVTQDFTVFLYSGSGNVSAEVVFAGYGITLPQKQYDDYAGINVQGKIVLVFRHGPAGDQSWQNDFGVWNFGYKVRTAAEHGAAGLILINRYTQPPEPGSGTLTIQGHVEGFPAAWVHRAVAEYLVNGTGRSLEESQQSIDQTLKPLSFPIGKRVNLTVTSEFDPERRTMNVIGAIEGQDSNLKDEAIIVSAHYDHLGMSPLGEIYYGADDDASGTAVMLEVARTMSKFAAEANYPRTIVFVGWSAEEEGLVGSSYYVDNPTMSIEKTVAVLQLDMVGVGNGNGLLVFNGNTFPSLTQLLSDAGKLSGIEVIPRDATSNSDHAPFAQRGVPAVLLFTEGTHPNYHTPNDRAEFIDPSLPAKVARLVVVAAWSLATDEPITAVTVTTTPILGPVAHTSLPRKLI